MNCHSIEPAALVLLHQESLKAYGGVAGLCNAGLLAAALSSPLRLLAQPETDVADLAAAYAAGILRHAPFMDGNDRAAFLAMGMFLYLNGWPLAASPHDAAQTMQALASGAIDEGRLADWIRLSL